MEEPLAALWRQRHPPVPPLAHTFRTRFADRWVRYHSLPESKRYAESEEEYAVVLDRYNTALDELFAGQDVYVVTTEWSVTPDGPAGRPSPRRELHPGGVHWWTDADVSDPDPEFHTYTRLYVDRRPRRRGRADALLRAVADEQIVDVFFTDTGLRRIHCPYDGGADLILTGSAERDEFLERHSAWLSDYRSGR
ncbi:hypothetical protein QNN03_12215 [Streptomyces sp. GXMU-J15]|uniref:DUF3885 domain-containing protein n=1 Tax=Streptomyces fuscus TaxID=3048495 RepID=A0ABT7IX78_9ACTN|nr:hypothetical protein [Streptomyces fuscus]MDL2077205.1 hypothetical protein [Streptomyces fuscus]